MISKEFILSPETPDVRLTAYVLADSPEFRPGERRPAVVVCPGGAYVYTSDREAEPIALRFAAHGYHAFVLRYTVKQPFPAPMLDLARALQWVRAHADEYRVDSRRIAVCGFSAGGHLTASLGTLWDRPFLYQPLDTTPEDIRPDALILGYPVVDLEQVAPGPIGDLRDGDRVVDNDYVLAMAMGSDHPTPEQMATYRAADNVTAATPPAFIWHTAADALVPALNSLRFAAALAEHGVPYELHIFQDGPHGLALADETTAVGGAMVDAAARIWFDLAVNWLKKQFR